MPSVQRRRGGGWVKIWLTGTVENRRGDTVRVPDWDNPRLIWGKVISERMARAELPGQMVINVKKLITTPQPDMDIWCVALWEGKLYDIGTPADISTHTGQHFTSHSTILLRERPNTQWPGQGENPIG